jgi:hypothetical protein
MYYNTKPKSAPKGVTVMYFHSQCSWFLKILKILKILLGFVLFIKLLICYNVFNFDSRLKCQKVLCSVNAKNNNEPSILRTKTKNNWVQESRYLKEMEYLKKRS